MTENRNTDLTTKHAYSIFQESWWLDAAAPGAWDAAEVWEDDRLVARLPYVHKRRHRLDALTMPILTQFLGPWIFPVKEGQKARIAREKALFTELIERLPAYDWFGQAFHPSLTNWQPFYWQGFQQTTLYTYVIEDLSDLDAVFNAFERRKRHDIKRAARSLSVEWDLPGEEMYRHLERTLSRRGDQPHYSRTDFMRFHDAAVERERGRTVYVRDAEGEVHASALIVWDDDCAHLLVTSFDPKWRREGSGSLLIWEAIQWCAGRTRGFNFEGSMIEGVERSYRAFGGRQVPYLYVSRMNRRARVLVGGLELSRALLGKPPGGSTTRSGADLS